MYSLSLSVLLKHGFKSQNFVCNGCHDLTMLYLNLNYIAGITVKGVDYHCITNLLSAAGRTRYQLHSTSTCRLVHFDI